MVYKCCAMYCNTGYNNVETPKALGITMFSFPLKDEALVKQWLKRLCREDFVPTKHSRICSLHFKDDDIATERQDSNVTRTGKCSSSQRLKCRLKDGAVPTIFKNLPAHLNMPVPEKRINAQKVSANERRRVEESRHEDFVESFFDADRITSTSEICDKFKV